MEEGSKLDGGGGPSSAPDPDGRRRTRKGKSCKGALYHTSLRRSDGRNPLCVGITRTLHQVPSHTVGESEMETTKEGRSLSDFKYVCVGYSAFLDNKGKPSGKGESRAELPHCVGIELLIDRRPATAGHAPAHAAKEAETLWWSFPGVRYTVWLHKYDSEERSKRAQYCLSTILYSNWKIFQ